MLDRNDHPSSPRRLRRLTVGLVCTALSAPTSALAAAPAAAPAPAQNTAAATKLRLANADKATREGKWDVALALYSDAHRLAPTAASLLGMANCNHKLGRLVEAYEAYDELTKSYEKALSAADRKLVSERLAELSKQTGPVSIRVNESGASVSLDDTDLGLSPVPALIRRPVGTHKVRVTKEGFTPFVGPAEVAGNTPCIVEVELARVVTTGHAVLKEKNGQPVRVVLDGVDVGAAPWEGDLPPGHHEFSFRSSSLLSNPQGFDVVRGGKAELEAEATSSLAHVQIKTSDGKGLIFVDGSVKAEGAFTGDLPAGVHAIAVTREGFSRFDKTVTLANKDSYTETVTLERPKSMVEVAAKLERPYEGSYGGLNLVGSFGVGNGFNDELNINCRALGASACNTPVPRGGGLYGYVGYTWNPIGFEAFFGGEADATEQKASFDANTNNGQNPNAVPARNEHFTILRTGGTAGLRVRASFQTRAIRGSLAGGFGLSVREMILWRSVNISEQGYTTTPYVKSASYIAPALIVDGSLQFRLSESTALSIGALFIAENAGNAATTTASPNYKAYPTTLAGQELYPQGVAIPSPSYHLATSTQLFLGPYIGLAFGP